MLRFRPVGCAVELASNPSAQSSSDLTAALRALRPSGVRWFTVPNRSAGILLEGHSGHFGLGIRAVGSGNRSSRRLRSCTHIDWSRTLVGPPVDANPASTVAALAIWGLTATDFALVWIGTGVSSERGADWVGFVRDQAGGGCRLASGIRSMPTRIGIGSGPPSSGFCRENVAAVTLG